MKIAIIQGASPIAPGNYDFTDASAAAPNNDWFGSWFWEGLGGNGINTASMRFSFGACDKFGNNVSLGFAAQDATAGALGQASLSVVNCLSMPSTVLGAPAGPVAAFGSALATGVRLALTTAPATMRVSECALLSGSDAEMECGNVQFASGDTNKTVAFAHLAGKPDIVYLLISMGQTGGDSPGLGGSIGWYERLGGNMASSAFRLVSGANPTDLSGYCSSAHAGEILSASGVLADVTVDTVTDTGFRIHFSANPAQANLVGWIALRGKTSQLITQSSVPALPTAAGVATLVSGMGGPGPMCVMAMPGRFTVKDAFQRNDQAGHVGMCVAATPDRVATSQAASTATFQYNVGASVAKHRDTLNRFLSTQAVDGTDVIVGTVDSWLSDGLKVNFTGVNAAPIFAPVLAFGAGAVNHTFLLGSGSFDITGAPASVDLAADLDTGLYESVGSDLSNTVAPVVAFLDCGMFSIIGADIEFEKIIPPPLPLAPFPYYPVTARRMGWDQLVTLAGGQIRPYPAEIYTFGGGAIRRSFYENI